MKKLLSILLATILIITAMPLSVFYFTCSAATSGTTGDCTWSLNGTVLTISGNGVMGDYASGYPLPPWGEGITDVIIENGVTNIGDCAFIYCDSLKNMYIPNTVKTIGYNAFRECLNLTTITVPSTIISIGNGAFYNCESIEKVFIADVSAWCNIDFSSYDSNPMYYADHIYLNGELITDLIIPSNVTNIKKYAFNGCCDLNSVCVDENNNFYHSSGNCVIETKSKKIVFGCKNSVIPSDDSVTHIEERAFYGCTGLVNIVIPDNITVIGESAFEGCISLENITIGNGVTYISRNVFYNTDYYNNEDNWEEEVLYISNYLIEAKNTISGEYNIKQGTLLMATFAFSGCHNLGWVVVPNSMINISAYAFWQCSGLYSVTIGKSVEYIGNYAFYGCYNLRSLVIPNSVNRISSYAFQECKGLSYVTIPESVKNIYYGAFSKCRSLTRVYYLGDEKSKLNLFIDIDNDYLTKANWYYNSCIGSYVHKYDDSCDIDCNICDFVRETEHIYDNENDIDCNICGAKRILYIPGNINDDKVVDLSDVVVLAQVVAGWDTECNINALDCDGDGAINLEDLVLLARFVAGWDVTLH